MVVRGDDPGQGSGGLKTVNGIAELGGIRGAWLKDPEGNILSVVQLPAA
jgi:hypothetical protein